MDLVACSVAACDEGAEALLFSFAGLIGGGGVGLLTTPALGGLDENFDPANYTIAGRPDPEPGVIPLPASAVLLAGGLALLGACRGHRKPTARSAAPSPCHTGCSP